jgi:DNA-binding transcriptional ArsR family regulator
MISLADLITSRVRIKILTTFFTSPTKSFYVRELTRVTSEQINAVRRELLNLQKRGILSNQKRGNRVYYSLRPDHLFYEDLLRMITKTTDLGQALIKNRLKLGKIKFIMLSGRFARRLPPQKEQVDLLIIGDVVMAQLSELVKKFGDINYSVMSAEEFEFRKTRRDPFILKVISSSRLMLYGDEEDLLKKSE